MRLITPRAATADGGLSTESAVGGSAAPPDLAAMRERQDGGAASLCRAARGRWLLTGGLPSYRRDLSAVLDGWWGSGPSQTMM